MKIKFLVSLFVRTQPHTSTVCPLGSEVKICLIKSVIRLLYGIARICQAYALSACGNDCTMPFYLGHLKQYSCHTERHLTFLQPIVRGITGEPDRPPDNRHTFFSGKTDSAVFTISLKCAIIEYEEKGMRKFVILVCAFSALTMACKIASAKKEAYTVKQGLYDIGDLGASEIADLEGEWIFVPEKHVPPAEIFT